MNKYSFHFELKSPTPLLCLINASGFYGQGESRDSRISERFPFAKGGSIFRSLA
jgi:hypothetical protein